MIVYLGLSHLSLCYSAAALNKGYKVVIVDFKQNVDDYYLGKFRVQEPQLDVILNKYKKNFTISYNFNNFKNTKIFFLAKDLKTNNKNTVKTYEIIKLLKKISKLNKKKILVIKSQVPVGFTRKVNWKKNFKFHYVETLIFGQAISRANYPERIILGKYDISTKIPKVLDDYLKKFNCPILEMKYEESELTKGFINTYLAAQVITTNYLNEFSKKYGADWGKIRDALSLDKRIGRFAYLNPGLGLSGGNIERDLKTISDIRYNLKLDNHLTKIYLQYSDYFKKWVIRNINMFSKNKKIGVLGFTYKEGTLSTKNSPSRLLLKYDHLIHDHQINELQKLDENKNIKFIELEEVLKKSHTICIFHNYNMYKEINFKRYKNIRIILDPFKILKDNLLTNKTNIKYISL
jgi:UDPglucose 6-dehydrogenase